MKKFTLFGTILSAPILVLAGAALAADPQPGMGMDTGTSSTGSNSVAPAVLAPAQSSDMTTQLVMPPEAVVGKEVVNTEGDNVGEVSKIFGDKVIVEVGGFLGIGTHGVALAWKSLTTTGSGDDMKLHTTLTKEEIKALPEYAE